jgi:hypothetical protein
MGQDAPVLRVHVGAVTSSRYSNPMGNEFWFRAVVIGGAILSLALMGVLLFVK